MTLAIVGALYAIAALVRAISMPDLIARARDFPISFVDTIYHLRRVELILAGHLVPPFDRYSSYPTGGDFTWPPLFDYCIALPAWIVGLGDPSRAVIAWTAAIVSGLLGAAIVIPAFLLGRRLAGTAAGVLAGLFMATMPFHAAYAPFGRPDHHGAETALIGLYFAGLFACDAAVSRAGTRFRDLLGGGRPVPIGLMIATAAAGAALLSVQTGAVLLIALASAVLMLRAIGGVLRNESRESTFVAMFVPQAVAAAAVFLLTLFWGGHRRLDFVYNQPSMFQPTLFALFGLFPLYLHLASVGVGKFVPMRWVRAGLLAAGAVVLFLVVPLTASPALFDTIRAAGGWVGKDEVYLQTVLETQPLFVRDGSWTFAPAWRHAGLALPLGLLGVLVLLAMSRRRRSGAGDGGESTAADALFVLIWTLSFFLLASFQLRFLNFAVLPIALAGAVALARLGAGSHLGRILAFMTSSAVVICGIALSYDALTNRVVMQDKLVLEGCHWLATQTPDPGSFLDPDEPAEYGVMTNPTFGHHVVYLGRRPATSNPFFDLDALGRTADFFLADGPEAAVRAMERAQCRYAVLSMRCYDMWFYYSLLSEERREDWLAAMPLDELETMRLLAQGPCMGLYFSDAAERVEFELPGGRFAAENDYDRFRLVYESEETLAADAPDVPFVGRAVPMWKVFELVEGARVRGTGPRGATAELSIRVRTSRGREFDWRRSAILGEDRRFSFVVPYAAEAADATVTIAANGRVVSTKNVAIPEAAVIDGMEIEVAR